MSDSQELNPEPAWASTSGHVELRAMNNANPDTDRALIAERIYRYGWAYDERNADLLGDCFTPDGVWEGSIMGQQSVGPFEGRESIVEFLASFWTIQADQRRHIFSNVIIDKIDSDEAVAQAYLILTASSNSTMTPVTTGPYRFQFAKESEIWRIVRLSGGFDAPF
jgi:hypothetical protein